VDRVKEELAMFKFSVIAPIVNGTYKGPATEYFAEAAACEFDVPGAGKRRFMPSTIKSWLGLYRKYGLDGLHPRKRSDAGKQRRLTEPMREILRDAKVAHPCKPVTMIYRECIAKGLLGADAPSLATVNRYLSTVKLPEKDPKVEHRRFQMTHANECWQADALSGPCIPVKGRMRRTYLIAVIDDASRLIPHAEFFFEANTQAFESVLKTAFARRGLPAKVFSDNGKIFRSLHIRSALARLGVVSSFARPYSPESRGKIERFFRTLREQLLAGDEAEDIDSLEDLNTILFHYVFEVYNLRPHSALAGMSPLDRFLKDAKLLRPCPSSEQIDQAFLRETTRKVSKDAVVHVDRVQFELPQMLIGQTVVIRYNPHDMSAVTVAAPGAEPIRVAPLDSVANAYLPRRQNHLPGISYADLYSGGKKDV